MTKEELIQFLKDNLKIELEEHGVYYGETDRRSYSILLKLGDEVISEQYLDIN